MSAPSVSTFNAAPSMAGYLYQVRLALLWALRQNKIGDYAVSIEVLDDVSFAQSGDPIAVLQTKHSTKSVSELSDLSSELWKTLRIWMVGVATGEIPASVAKFLISTGGAKPGSACFALTQDLSTRDVVTAGARLVHAASTSSNAELKDAFESFLKLDGKVREQLLQNIYVTSTSESSPASSPTAAWKARRGSSRLATGWSRRS
jgi:hypothetical protein